MRKLTPAAWLLTAWSLTFSFSPAIANDWEQGDSKGIFNVVFENDIFAGSDREYTNGVRFSWLSSEENMPDWARSAAGVLPLSGDGFKRISLAAGQSMFAPENLRAREPLTGGRPYAGWLYGSIGMMSDTGTTHDNVMFTLGVVGPYSYAEQTQKIVHDIINSPDPKGWNNQLEHEIGAVLTYERKWRGIYEYSPFGAGADVIPHAGINLGNVITDAVLGATFRLGYDLPADYGPPRIRPSLSGSDFFIPTKKVGGYLFTTFSGGVVGRNIFLDGNTFRDSPDVDKKNFISSLQLGGVMTFNQTRISYTHVFMSREYDSQEHPAVFGALTLSQRF